MKGMGSEGRRSMRHHEQLRGAIPGVRHRRAGRRETAVRRSLADKTGEKRHLRARILLIVRRSVPFIYAAMVAIVTLLPSAPATRVRFFADQAIDFHVAFSYVSVLVLSVCLILAAIKLKMVLKFSWPLFAVVASYAAIVSMLILEGLRNSVRGGLTYDGAAWIAEISASLDVHHAIIYAVFAVTAAIGWRDRIVLPVLGVILITCGVVLEVWQEYVPGRTFRMVDIVSNSIGVVIGVTGVRLMDALRGRSLTRSPASTSRRRWKQSTHRRRGPSHGG